MTVRELMRMLSDYDPEIEIKAKNQFDETFDFDNHVWQWDNSVDPPKLNTYLTIDIKQQLKPNRSHE